MKHFIEQTAHGLLPHGFDSPGNYRWLKDMMKPLKPHFLEITSISLFANILALVVPIFTMQVYDRVVGHNAVSTLVALLCGVLLALVFDFLLRQTRSRMLQQISLKLDAELGRAVYDKLTSLPLVTLEARPASFWQSLFNDASTVRSVFSGPTAVLVTDLPFALLFLIIIFVVATPVAWVLLLVIPLFLTLTWLSSRVLSLSTTRERRSQQSREGLLAEILHGRATVKALRIDKAIQPEWEAQHARSISLSFERGSKSDTFIAMGQTLALLTTVTLVSVGALAIIERDMTVGSLIATTMLSSRIVAPMNQLLSSWRSFATFKQSLLRLERLFHSESERDVPAIDRETPKGQITLEKVCYSYRENNPVVSDISIGLPAGEMIALVGRNGCGKTTLIKLLQGLYAPESGRVMLDGHDIKQFSRRELAQWIGYVPQECFLFSGTIKENISRAFPDATDEKILRAAKLAGADSFISSQPDGYATEIGEGGMRLSGGQRQRIGIARALVASPPILVFDEMTSNLDSQTEAELARSIRSLTPKHTVIMATHSMMMLQQCDKILVMEKGKLAIAGPARDVLMKLAEADNQKRQQQAGGTPS